MNKKILKRILKISLGLFFLYGIYVTVDVLTVPVLPIDAQTMAFEYLKTNNLPTPPRPFTYDGCTAWPDELPYHKFEVACIKHDIAYWAGGPETLKVVADAQFAIDLHEAGPLGQDVFAPIMYNAVKHGGNNAFSEAIGSNWGYGYNEPIIQSSIQAELP